jgi:hypothetical protein
MMRDIKLILSLIALIPLVGCASSGLQVQIDPQVHLTVQFCDAGWDGRAIPVAGRCQDCGGLGRSPALRIGGLPAEATEVIVEFDDLRILDLREDGGHGTIAIATGGKPEVVLPSVDEETMSLPPGVRCVRQHRCVIFGHDPGAFKAPCGCGQGNEYAATVMAVRQSGELGVVLARTVINLGAF